MSLTLICRWQALPMLSPACLVIALLFKILSVKRFVHTLDSSLPNYLVYANCAKCVWPLATKSPEQLISYNILYFKYTCLLFKLITDLKVQSIQVPLFVMNVTSFFSAYLVGFLLLWRLAIIGLPFVVLLVVPGLIYGRTLMEIARKMKDESSKAGTIVEKAISSIRTVYSFVGESKTIKEYSAALQGTVDLGLKQGLSKGLAVGSNSLVFAIWAFMSYYGSRMVMYHGAHGGTVFAVGCANAVGGL